MRGYLEELLRVARGESRTQLIMARGTRSEFLAKEGMPGPDGRLFETKLGFGRFLNETPKSMLVTVTPSMVHKEMPAMTLQQWLAIFRLHQARTLCGASWTAPQILTRARQLSEA